MRRVTVSRAEVSCPPCSSAIPRRRRHSRQTVKIIGLAENESVHPVADQTSHAGMNGSNRGEAAGHSFQHRQAEGVFPTRADVDIRCGVKIENILARRFKTAALRDAKRFRHFKEKIWRIVPGDDEVNWQFSKVAHSAQYRFKPLDTPIVADEQKNEVTLLKISLLSRLWTEREPRGRRKLR